MTTATAPQVTHQPPMLSDGRRHFVLVGAATVAAIVVAMGSGPFLLHLIAGLFLLIALPVQLVNAKVSWPATTKLHESLLYSLALVVLGLIVGGLAINTILPIVGIGRPLDRTPVVATLLVAVTALAVWRRGRWRLRDGIAESAQKHPSPMTGVRDQTLVVAGILTVAAAVAGAIRLNNNAGSSVTVAMLILAAFVIVGVFSWRNAVRDTTIMLTIYLLSLALLLTTSLRGWFITGHDIQREFRVFELASDHGLWDVGLFRSAYNACLSVTILPTIIEHVTDIPDIYLFKTIFQALYALCPVLIYLIARRFASKSVALLGSIYFIAFPTYFTDMPFLNRQEVAFFFLGIGLLVNTDHNLAMRTRRIGFTVFGAGVILSHYSTTYVLLGVLVVGWAMSKSAALARLIIQKRARRRGRSRHRSREDDIPAMLHWTIIVTLGLLTFLWGGLLTGTASQAEETFSSTVNSLKGLGSGQRSSDAAYSLFGGAKPTPQERLTDYQSASIDTTDDGRQNNVNYPLEEVRKYPTPIAPDEELPVTTLGHAIEDAGLSVSTINRVLRGGAPSMLQVFVGLGFLLVAVGRVREFRPNREFLVVAAACITVISLHVLLPNVSVDYGILRTFAQGLFWLAPFLAVGSIQAFSWLGRKAALRIALGLATLFFLSLTGVISQLLGGYPPQLHLNNSGQYYDNYYLHGQEVSAIQWLQRRVTEDAAASVQSEVATDRYATTRLQNYSEIKTADDIFPMLIRRDAYAFLGYTAVRNDEVTFLFSGDLVTYKYPMAFLDNNKSLVYSSNSSRIYR